MGSISFTTWTFAAAGALCALGPLIIHLLNRRRYRVVQWAAMDFLREALKENRRILNLRDLILLVLRTAAVLLFGFALARPYLARKEQALVAGEPLHAVVFIDNSLSMGYESLDGSLLDRSLDRARQIIAQLPAGSRITVIPACGSRHLRSTDPFDTKEAALESLTRIETVDRSLSISSLAGEVRRASQAVPELAPRVVLITDQQELNWRGVKDTDVLADLPPVQVVSVAPAEWENTWIADLRVQDGLADVETPSTVIVELSHRGAAPRRDVQVTLSLGDTTIGQKTVTIEPGAGTREVEFECLFGGLVELPESNEPVYATLRASLPPDRLPADDERALAVPVVAALPVVFIDQFAAGDEDISRGRVGETRHLRRLLAPKSGEADAPRQLVSVRHLTPAEITPDRLTDVRLVVIAGLREPGAMVPVLTEYIRQGGQLLLAAGADFDPAAWNDAAWRDGQGLLPLPLADEPLGRNPDESSGELRPFFLSLDSLIGEAFFQLAGVGVAELRDLYTEPFFFKSVVVDSSPQVMDSLQRSLTDRQIVSTTPAGDVPAELQLPSPGIADFLPRIFARYDLPAQPPFLVSRKIGRGEVVFCSTGLLSPWNTLPKTNAMLIFDRILRGLIQNTLPRHNFLALDHFKLPLPPQEQNLLVTLDRPGQKNAEPIDVSYIAADQRGIELTGLLQRGVYRVRGYRPSAADVAVPSQSVVWDVPLAVNGQSEESDLTPLARRAFDELAGDTPLVLVPGNREIDLTGATTSGRHSWWWLVAAVLALLLAEMSVLLWPLAPHIGPTSRDLTGPGAARVSSHRTLSQHP